MPDFPANLRLILAHKQKTSARLRFLRFPHGMTAFMPLPTLSVVEEEGEGEPSVALHPNAWLRAAEQRLKLDNGSLKAETEYHATVQTPDGPVTVQLATINYVDPPFAEAEAAGCRFIAITEARDCTPVELELLRRAYTVVIG
ncbi:MAG: hypothetical protein AB1899_14290 [Pseudomonadota bacterium]